MACKPSCTWPKITTCLAVLSGVLLTALGMYVYCTLSVLKDVKEHNVTLEESAPSRVYEMTRRRILLETRDMWYYINSELTTFTATTNDTNILEKSKRVLEENEQRHLSLVRHLRNLSSMDGLGEWRMQEAKDLADIVQSRLQNLQNPADCATAKKAVCDLTQAKCGTCCQLNHVIYCLVMAYATQRTLILDSTNWNGNEQGWEALFKPLSDTCVNSNGTSSAKWPGTKDTQVLQIPYRLEVNVDFMPPTIPQDLSERLIRLHGHPGVWWMGQLFKYLLRPNDVLEGILKEKESIMDFKNPIAGIQVRRSDKVEGPQKEGSFHSLEEYMFYVEHHFKLLELEIPGIQRTVYIATDEPKLFEEAKTKYPHYTFLGDPNIASLVKDTSTRSSDTALKGLLADIHFLSKSDFIVCTFSSRVCKLAYTLMQTYHPDASADVQSLDDVFYYIQQPEHLQRAVASHIPRDPTEIDLQAGDLIHISGNFWNGSTKGINKRSGNKGLYPSYKVEEVINVAQMPIEP